MTRIDQALTDRNLLGAAFGNPLTWNCWLSTLRATYALPMSTNDLANFSQVAGHRKPPTKRVRELWCLVGRRSGKSRIAAALAVFNATFIKHKLARGEVGTVLVLAASQAQAKVVFDYCLGYLEASPVLAREIASTTTSEIRLRNGSIIAVHANSYKTVRGKTLLCCIFDEVAMWRDADSALPDIETYRAVLPSLVTTNGLLVGISSPYRKTGLLFEKFRNHFGQDSDEVLVVQGASRTFNPTLDQAVITAASAADPEAAIAEWEGNFRSDISAFLDDTTIDACTDYNRPLEIPPRQGVRYQALVDPSGGRHDHFTICVGHREGADNLYFVADAVRGRAPPFDPEQVVAEYVALLKGYKITNVTGDNYSAAWAEVAFKKAGIRYVRSEFNKSELYLEALPMFMRLAISLPNHPKLLRELRLLERRASRMGKDVVDHGRNGSDDYANVVVGALKALAPGSYNRNFKEWVGTDSETDDKSKDGRQTHAAQMLLWHLRSHGIRV